MVWCPLELNMGAIGCTAGIAVSAGLRPQISVSVTPYSSAPLFVPHVVASSIIARESLPLLAQNIGLVRGKLDRGDRACHTQSTVLRTAVFLRTSKEALHCECRRLLREPGSGRVRLRRRRAFLSAPRWGTPHTPEERAQSPRRLSACAHALRRAHFTLFFLRLLLYLFWPLFLRRSKCLIPREQSKGWVGTPSLPARSRYAVIVGRCAACSVTWLLTTPHRSRLPYDGPRRTRLLAPANPFGYDPDWLGSSAQWP